LKYQTSNPNVTCKIQKSLQHTGQHSHFVNAHAHAEAKLTQCSYPADGPIA